MAATLAARQAWRAGSWTRVMVARLTGRLIRRGTLLMALAVAAYAALEVVTYQKTYPDAASREHLSSLQDSPAVRMFQGVPHAIDTPGGFVVWDAGWVLLTIVGLWAILTTTRLLRGEEESDRADLVLAAPIRADRITVLQCLVVVGATIVFGAAAAVVMTATGTGVTGAVAFGLGLAGVAATFAGVAAISSQVFEVRRRATGAAAAVFGATFLIRMIANTNDARGWLRWTTPFGWVDDLHPYPEPRWTALLPLVVVPALLFAVAVRLRHSRDTGGALFAEPDRRPPRLGFLGGPVAFAWRATQGMFVGWLVGVTAYALIIGSTVKAMTDFLAKDPNYQKVLKAIGWDAAQVTQGFVGIMGIFFGVLFSLYVCWRIGTVRTEEASGRADNTLARPVRRSRWLGAHVGLALAGALVIALVAGLGMWIGAVATGAPVSVRQTLGAVSNSLSVVVLFTGLAVLVYGIAPRLTVVWSVTAVVTAYLVQTIGPVLRWPNWVMDLAPFHHLATVPSQPFALVSAVVMCCLGAAVIGLGIALFARRDLTGD